MPGSSMIASFVEFLKDPIRLLGSLYSWLGWPISTLGVAAVWLAERPSETLARVPWFRSSEWHQDEGFQSLLDLVGAIDPAYLVLVSISVLVVLPVRASVEGWFDVEDCIDLVSRRSRPAIVTSWLVTVVSLEAHPASVSDLAARGQEAARIVWAFLGRPLSIGMIVLAALVALALVVLHLVRARLDDPIVVDELVDKVVDDWLPILGNLFGSLVMGLAMMLLSAPFEPLVRPLRVLSFCLGLEEVQHPESLYVPQGGWVRSSL